MNCSVVTLSRPPEIRGKLRYMSDPDLDKKLLDFLEREKANPIEEIRKTLKTVIDWQLEHEQKDDDRHREAVGWRVSQDSRMQNAETAIQLAKNDIQHLNKDVDRVEEASGSHDVAEILRAASTLGKPGASIRPKDNHNGNSFMKAMRTEAAKGIGKGIGVLLLLIAGWFAHHISVSWGPSAAPPASEPLKR